MVNVVRELNAVTHELKQPDSVYNVVKISTKKREPIKGGDSMKVGIDINDDGVVDTVVDLDAVRRKLIMLWTSLGGVVVCICTWLL